MRFNRSENFQPIGPRFTQVESPHIMLASRPLDAGSVAPEEAILISERDGTLISYYEEWDGKQYGVTLEMLDPDGLFISKMFSMYIENMRTYFANVKDSVDTVGRSEQIRTLYNKHKLFN